MTFWERVIVLLENKDISRKELAAQAKFDVSNIGKGAANANMPNAETAVRIAQILGTSVEYLVTGKNPAQPKENSQELDTLYKYSHTIMALDSIPETNRKPIETMIYSMQENYLQAKDKK